MKELLFNKPFRISAMRVKEGFLLLEWPLEIDSDINDHVIHISKKIKTALAKYILDVVPTYQSLGVYYRGLKYRNLIEKVKDLDFNTMDRSTSQKHIIPVCYDEQYGPDMERVSERHHLKSGDIIKRHTDQTYKVCFIGFLPGFLYLSGLDPSLTTPRLNTPRMKILPGSVGIGGSQTGIYPISSPGGWNIIGRCPLKLFDVHNEGKLCRYEAGDQVQFQSISRVEFDVLNEHGL